MNVAELVALLRQHGISTPGQAEPVSATADASAAAAPTSDAAVEAPATEPEESTLGADTGFIRCPNCHTGLAVFAAVATVATGPSTTAPATSTTISATSTRAPAASTSASITASITQPGPVSSASRSARWYAVTRGREIGVFFSRWDGHIQNLVTNVPRGNAVRFATEEEARHYYHLQELAGNTHAVPLA